MASWILVPCLVQLRAEFNALAPARSKESDGSIGDAAHQAEVSDHNPDEVGSVPIHDADSTNEVHAIDVTAAGPWPQMGDGPGSMEKVVQFLLGRCRSGAEKRLRYIIYRRRIWSASSGWVEKPYTGASPHTEHAHFSSSYDTAREASTASWHLEDLVALTPEEIKAIATAVWTGVTFENPFDKTGPQLYPATFLRYAGRRDDIVNATVAKLGPLLAKADVDESEIAAFVLGGLTPEKLAAALVAAGLSPTAIAAGIPTGIAKQVADELAARLGS